MASVFGKIRIQAARACISTPWNEAWGFLSKNRLILAYDPQLNSTHNSTLRLRVFDTQRVRSEAAALQLYNPQLHKPHFNKLWLNQTRLNQTQLNKPQLYIPQLYNPQLYNFQFKKHQLNKTQFFNPQPNNPRSLDGRLCLDLLVSEPRLKRIPQISLCFRRFSQLLWLPPTSFLRREIFSNQEYLTFSRIFSRSVLHLH